MTNSRACADSLIVRARAGSLGPQEQLQLDAHLSQCALCRTLFEIESEFDDVLVPRTGDEMHAARFADFALAAMSVEQNVVVPIASRRSKARLYLLVAAVVSISLSAAAAWFGSRSRDPTHVRAHLEHSVNSPQVAIVPVSTVLVEPVHETSMDSAVSPQPSIAPTPAVAVVTHHVRSATSALPADSEATADTLFIQANASRHGDAVRARALYSELQRRFPRSTEALVSRVSLGRLLLEELHDPTKALAQFDGYLHQSTHTVLRSEALFGRAKALMQLGRHGDERATWQQLLDQFPDSAYSQRARARLEQLR